MKARVKATGEIVNVISMWDSGKSYYERLDVCDTKPIRYSVDELDFSDILGEAYEPTYTPNYWTRLEHQYAGMVMQSILQTMPRVSNLDKYMKAAIDFSAEIARALVEKYKEKEERK